MTHDEIEEVLRNWIQQAIASTGQLVPGIDPAQFVAKNFIQWWRTQVDKQFGAAELAVHSVRKELDRLGGWKNQELGEALHELVHLTEALEEMRFVLGLKSLG